MSTQDMSGDPGMPATRPPSQEPQGWKAWLLLIPIFGAIALFVFLAVGAAQGGTYIHKGSATNAALFSGGAVTNAQKHAASTVVRCGQKTGTIAGISYSVGPFIVHSVKLEKVFEVNPKAAAKALGSCLIRDFAPDGAAVQICTIQAQHQPGLTQFTAGPYAEAVVICSGES